MLVYFFRWKKAEVEHFARMQHRMRERRQFLARHSPQHDGHKPGGNLVIGNAARRVAVDDVGDFGGRQRAPIPLFADKVNDAERLLDNSWLAHLRRKPSGKSSVMWLSLSPCWP